MTEPRTIAEHRAASSPPSNTPAPSSRDQHPDVPAVVIVTGGRNQPEGHPEG